MLIMEQLHFNMQSNILFLLVDDDIRPQRINISSLNYINKSIMIPGIYKAWIYKQ